MMRLAQLAELTSNAMESWTISSITDPDVSPIASVVHVDPENGERTIFWNTKRFRLLRPTDVPLEAVRRAKLVVADRYEQHVLPTILETVREAGGRSVLDIERGDPEIAFRLLELATDCILPLSEACALTGEDKPELARINHTCD
jgi:sulfofructose kinase